MNPQLNVRFLKGGDYSPILLLSVTIPSQAGLANSEHLFVKHRCSLNTGVKSVTKIVQIHKNARFLKGCDNDAALQCSQPDVATWSSMDLVVPVL